MTKCLYLSDKCMYKHRSWISAGTYLSWKRSELTGTWVDRDLSWQVPELTEIWVERYLSWQRSELTGTWVDRDLRGIGWFPAVPTLRTLFYRSQLSHIREFLKILCINIFGPNNSSWREYKLTFSKKIAPTKMKYVMLTIQERVVQRRCVKYKNMKGWAFPERWCCCPGWTTSWEIWRLTRSTWRGELRLKHAR